MDRELQELLTDTCTVEPFSSAGAYQEPVYTGVLTTHPCRVEMRQSRVMNQQGQEVVASMTVYLAPSSTGGLPTNCARDRLTLSDGSQPEVKAFKALPDETGATYYVAFYCA